MHEYTPEAAQAIQSRSRQFTHRLMIDWNNDEHYGHELSDMSQYVVRTSRDQAISSTAPDELMLIEGYGAAKLDIEVAGKYKNLPLTGHFAPYNGRSIFYKNGLQLGVQMYYDIGVWTDKGWEWYRQFTGTVREMNASRGDGIVELNCLDRVETMRTTVDLPAYAGFTKHLETGHKRGGLVDSSSLIDLAARSAGFTMGPEFGPFWFDDKIATVLRVPMHGSYLPEIGMLDNAQEIHRTETWERDGRKYRSEAYRSGPHGYLALNAVPKGEEALGYKKYWVDTQIPQNNYGHGGAWAMSCWLYWEGPDKSADSTVINVRSQHQNWQLVVEGSNGGVNTRFKGASGNLYMSDATWKTMTPGWNFIEARLANDEGLNRVDAQTWCNGEASPVTTIYDAYAPWTANDWLTGLVTVENLYAISDVEVMYTPWASWMEFLDKSPHDEVVGNAHISYGRNRIMYTLKQSTSAWDLAKDIASAEYGVVMFDEHGKFQFWNFEDVTALQSTVQRTFDLSDVEGLSMRTTMDSVRNAWMVTTKTGQAGWGIAYDLAKEGAPLWAPNDNGHLSDLSSNVIFRVADFRIPSKKWGFFWLRGKENMVCPQTAHIPTLAEFGEWNERDPFHAKKGYHGNTYAGVDNTFETEQKWIGREYVRLSVYNGSPLMAGFWLNSKDQGRFRMAGTMVTEDEPATWEITTSDVARREPGGDENAAYAKSIARYGRRAIELKENFWLQDRFQTEAMLTKVIKKFGRPIPVTDNITVPGDPRIQIGDVIEINDWEGMGQNIRLQVYGVQRDLEEGSGLTDTYQVEVIETPGTGVWDSESYGVWDQNFLWA